MPTQSAEEKEGPLRQVAGEFLRHIVAMAVDFCACATRVAAKSETWSFSRTPGFACPKQGRRLP